MLMNVLIHDLGEYPLWDLGDRFEVINANVKAAPCQGCFRCWTKNAGHCVYRDAFQHIGAAVGNSENIVIISRLCYGGYSPAVKRLLDRGISDSLPFLTFRRGRTYHIGRYKIKRNLTVYFYGGCSEFERETAEEYVSRHAVNMEANTHKVFFAEDFEDLGMIEV